MPPSLAPASAPRVPAPTHPSAGPTGGGAPPRDSHADTETLHLPGSFLSRKWSPFSRLGSNSASSGRPTSAVPRYTATPRLHPLHTTWCQILMRMNKRLKLSFLPTIVPEPEAVLEGNWKCSRYPQTAEHYRPKEPYWSHKIEPQPHPGAPLKSKDSYATCQPQKLWWGTRCHDSAGSTLNTVTEDLLSTGHHTSYAQRTTRTPH